MTSAPEPVTPGGADDAAEAKPSSTNGAATRGSEAKEPRVASAEPAADEGLVEWVLRRRAIAKAKGAYLDASPEQRELYRRARLALEVGDRTLDPLEPFRDGSAAPLAIEAYRESVHWSLALFSAASHPDVAPARTVAELWASADPAVLTLAPENARARVRELVVDRSFVEVADEPETVQVAYARVLKEFATALVARAEGPQELIDRYERERSARTMGVLFVAIVLAALAFVGGRALLRPKDLAAGKPWQASSTWSECDPKHRTCGPVHDTGIFFHTNEDASPWVQFDLGAPTKFSWLTVKNRSDCCSERAVPLIAEVSDDGNTWREVARRKEDFATWTPKFAPVTARYLRLRVARKSWLHLEKVEVHP